MNSTKGVKSGVPERVNISCLTCGTRHDSHQLTGNQSYVTIGKQTNITLMKSNSDIQQLYSTAKVLVNNLFEWFCANKL